MEFIVFACGRDVTISTIRPHKDKQDQSCIKVRTGFAIRIVICPLVW